MARALIVGPDRGLEAPLAEHGVETVRIETPASGEDLERAGVADASLCFLTDAAEATLVSVARERHPEIRIVWYAPRTVPEFATRQLDLGVDPTLIGPTVLVEEQLASLDA
ncbi:MAG: CTP synthetase [Halodesulfurarchaeum sp.]